MGLLKTKTKTLILFLVILLTGLSGTSIVQPPQVVQSQTDYEEYLIVEPNNERPQKNIVRNAETNDKQNLFQNNIGSGSSTNINCAQNLIDGTSDLDCPELTPPVPPTPGDCTDSVSDTIPVGDLPLGIIYNSFNDRIYVANSVVGTLSVIDPSTNEVVDGIEVGNYPINLAFNPSNGIVYVVNYASETVSLISGTTNEVIENIEVPNPYGIAVHSPSGKIYATSGSAVVVIDPLTNTISRSIDVANSPLSAGFNPINGYIYAASSGSTGVVSVIDPVIDEVIDTISVGLSPQGIAFNPYNGNVYITNGGTGTSPGNTVSVIEGTTNEIIDTIEVTGFFPVGIAFNSNNDRIYVAVVGSAFEPENHVSVIDANSNEEIDTVEVGLHPFFVAFNPISGNAYVTNYGSDTVSVISCIPDQ